MSIHTPSRAALIEQALIKDFSPTVLTINNESHLHHTKLTNPETHFNVTLVCEHFTNQSRVVRHKAVYQCLQAIMQMGIHALSLHLYTPKEWETQQHNLTASPRCLGGFHEHH